MASPSILQQISEIANTVIALALLVLVGIAVMFAWRARATYRKVNRVLDRIQTDIAPLVQRLAAIADDIGFVTKSIRGDVQKVNATVAAANDRVQDAVAVTEKRLHEFNALLAVVQDEAEDVFVSTAAAVRGVRGGAEAFRRGGTRGGMDLASDELDAAALADEIEDHIEDQMDSEEGYHGHDRTPNPSAEPLSAAPRVEPRIRGARRRGI